MGSLVKSMHSKHSRQVTHLNYGKYDEKKGVVKKHSSGGYSFSSLILVKEDSDEKMLWFFCLNLKNNL